MDLAANLQAWVVGEVGATGTWARLDARRGSTGVWGFDGADGRGWVVKQFASARGFAQERAALLEWRCSGPAPAAARMPTVHASHAGLRALLLDRLPGVVVDDTGGEAAVQTAAGRFLAELHRREIVDTDPLAVGLALEQRTATWLRRGQLERSIVEAVERWGPRAALFAGVRRVPCHRDFTPRNWLWDGQRLAVVDFEHARPDVALGDLAKLHVDCWSARPDLEGAFYAGYGHPPTLAEHEQLRALLMLHGVASLVWGREHGVASHIDEGERALALAERWAERSAERWDSGR